MTFRGDSIEYPQMIEMQQGSDKRGIVKIKGDAYDVLFGDLDHIERRYYYQSITFLDKSQSERMNGGIYLLQPYVVTRVVMLTQEELWSTVANLEGNGWLLKATRENEVRTDEFWETQQCSRSYRGRDVVCFAAGRKGVKLIELCDPPFIEGRELVAEVGQRQIGKRWINPNFWNMHQLLRRT